MADRLTKYHNYKFDQPRRTTTPVTGNEYKTTNAEYAKELGVSTRQASKIRNGKKKAPQTNG
jgi:hypothetical protein